MSRDALPWAQWWRPRCRARREPKATSPGWHGRCELVAWHPGDHALDRGMDTPRWSTEWTR